MLAKSFQFSGAQNGLGGLGGWGLQDGAGWLAESFPHPAAAPRWLGPWAVGPQPINPPRSSFEAPNILYDALELLKAPELF